MGDSSSLLMIRDFKVSLKTKPKEVRLPSVSERQAKSVLLSFSAFVIKILLMPLL